MLFRSGDVVNFSCLPFDLSLSLMQLWSLGFLAISILVFTFVSTRKRDF